MKHKATMAIALLALMLMIAPVSALSKSVGNKTQAVYSGNWAMNTNWTVEDWGDACAAYGGTPYVPDHDFIVGFLNWDTFPANLTSAIFYYDADYDPVVYPEGSSFVINNPTYKDYNWVAQITQCEDATTSWAITKYYTLYNSSEYLPPVEASFVCVPTTQYPNEDVVCTDTSTNNPDTWLWSIDLEALGIDGWQTSTSQDFTWQSPYPGWYSVNLWANNTGGGDWENKTNYVFISPNATPNNCEVPIATGYSRTFFRCADTNTDASISGCDIQLQDIEGGLWSNITDRDDGIWCIDTLPLHNINAYGQATGYTDGSRIGVREWNMMRYIIPMIPGYLPQAANGSVWVYVHVTDFSGSVSLSGATVSLSGLGLPTVVETTDSSGIALLQWPNVTTAYINAVKPGYTTGMRVIETSDFGPDFVTIALHQGTFTSTITPTPTISGAPTAAPTWAPYCNPDASDYDSGKCNQAKDADMMNQVRDAGPMLIGLAIIATIVGLVKLMGKK